MAKDLLRRYSDTDPFLDIQDQNLRAEIIEFLISSTPDDGFVAGDGIFPRRGKVKSVVFACAQITGEPDSGATANIYKVKLLEDRFRPADSSAVADLAAGNLTVDPNKEELEFNAINLAERFPIGGGGSHLITQNGWIVRLLIATIEFAPGDRRTLAYFWLPVRPLLFPVDCTVDGGVEGGDLDSEGNCTFTYTVKTEDASRTIETTVSPERRRRRLTRYKTESVIDADDGNSPGFAYYTPDGTLKLSFVLNELENPRRRLVCVDCTKDGGVAGDKDTDCSFTYTVEDEFGFIAAGLTPVRRRMPKTTYLVESTNGAADDKSEGFGYFSASGEFILKMVVSELPDPLPCPDSSGA